MEIEKVFIHMLKEHVDELRNKTLLKGKFIGKYIEQINKIDRKNAFRYKSPQVVGHGEDSNNNWVDYLLGINDDEYYGFREVIMRD
jgi:CRISPR/Cas system endoribonuclease Cas6 (RAMP superfamily)